MISLKSFLTAVAVTSVFVSSATADTVYAVQPYSTFNDAGWGLTGGTITTDGTLGELTDANITDWSINYFSSATSFNLHPGNSVVLFSNSKPNGLTATATELLMAGAPDLPGNPEQLRFLESTPSLAYGVAYTASEPSDNGGINLYDFAAFPTSSFLLVTNGNSFVIGTVIPEPGSLILLTALAVPVLTRRRRR